MMVCYEIGIYHLVCWTQLRYLGQVHWSRSILFSQPEVSQAPGECMKHCWCLCSHIKLLEMPLGQHLHRHVNARCRSMLNCFYFREKFRNKSCAHIFMVWSCKCICFAYLCLIYKTYRTFIQQMLANHSNFHINKTFLEEGMVYLSRD